MPFKPSSLQEVGDYLVQEYAGLLKSGLSANFELWINQLIIDETGKRLACCIALETSSKLIKKDRYVSIFNEMDYQASTAPVWVFEQAIRRDVARLHFTCASSRRTGAKTGRYATAMKLDTFAIYYYNRSREQLNQVSSDDLLTSAEFADWRDGRKPMTIHPLRNEGGPMRREKWVFAYEQWLELRATALADYSSQADCLADLLGLTYYEDQEMICLLYPEAFAHPTFQPCAVNRDWSGQNLFISFPKGDNFGRTRNRSGNRAETRMKEQIHLPIEDNTDFYEVHYLGKTGNNPVDWQDIDLECLNRF